MAGIKYKGCVIVPEARKNPATGTWDVRLSFLCTDGRHPMHNPAYVPTDHNVKEEAVQHSLDTARGIVDLEVEDAGQIPEGPESDSSPRGSMKEEE